MTSPQTSEGTVGPSLDDICCQTVAARLESFSDCCAGNPLAQVACVSSAALPFPEDVAQALGKAFVALGWAGEPFFAVSTLQAAGVRLRDCLEAQDPLIVVALDSCAGDVIAEAYGVDGFPCGASVTTPLGRRIVVVEDFPGSLVSPDSKRKAWAQLRAATALR